MSFRRFLVAGLLVAGSTTVRAQAPATAPAARKPAQLPSDSMELARKYTKWFYNNQLDSLMVMVPAEHRDEARKQLAQNLSELGMRAGDEVSVIEEKFITRNGARQYWRTAKFSQAPDAVLLRWVIGPKGEYAGMGLGLARQAPAIDP